MLSLYTTEFLRWFFFAVGGRLVYLKSSPASQKDAYLLSWFVSAGTFPVIRFRAETKWGQDKGK